VDQRDEIILTAFGLTDTGLVRSQNQDSYLVADLSIETPLSELSTQNLIPDERKLAEQRVSEKGSLLVVADGMGGAAAGDIASQLGIDTLFAELLKSMSNGMRHNMPIPDILKSCVEKSNLRLWEESQFNIDYRGMGTTLTAVVIHEQAAYIAEVGDSRAYLVRTNRIEQVTKDQSAVQMLIDLGRITKEQAETAPNRNIILQALGVEPSVQVALTKVNLRHNDHLLLCSDGLSNKIAEDELCNLVIGPAPLDVACRNMVALANMRGGEDNITVVLAKFVGDSLPPPDENEPLSQSVEILASYFPAEPRRELHTSQFTRPNFNKRKRKTDVKK
jgi:PPM family protein phosphatase